MDEKEKTLRDAMPVECFETGYEETRAFKMADVKVIAEHCSLRPESLKVWPGIHKNIYFWVELENGCAVGWNENPARGWSFPVIKMKEKK